MDVDHTSYKIQEVLPRKVEVHNESTVVTRTKQQWGENSTEKLTLSSDNPVLTDIGTMTLFSRLVKGYTAI